MPDICDRADADIAFFDNLRLRELQQPTPPSAVLCQGCGHKIDPRRREALPGVQTCADCQNLAEDREKNIRRMFARDLSNSARR